MPQHDHLTVVISRIGEVNHLRWLQSPCSVSGKYMTAK